jgi:hypothetical protein
MINVLNTSLKAFFCILLIFTLFAMPLNGQEIITRWTFDNTTNPANGSGTASLVGGVTQHSASLSSGWRITDFPSQFTASGMAGAQFMVPTTGFSEIVLSFGHRSSGTMSRWAQIQYTTNGGQTWQVFDNNAGGLTPHDVVYEFSFGFPESSGAANNPLFGVRIVSIFSPVGFNPEVPNIFYPAHAAYHRARTPGTGGNAYSGDGNWRLLNVTFSGTPLVSDIPVKLAVTSINSGTPPSENTPFPVIVQAQDAGENPAAVTLDTQIILTKASGSGALGGTLLETMTTGNSSLVFNNVTYTHAEPGVSIKASTYKSLRDINARPVTQLPPALVESSGISVRNPNRIWSHNDSGNTNELFLFDTTGTLIRTLLISNATNVDWEDLAVDTQNRIYINDAGNNNNDRTDLRIYRIPDPQTIPGSSVNAAIINFSFEDQTQFPPPPANRNFDIEAMIWKSDSLFLFTKNRSNPQTGYSKMYKLPAQPGTHTAILFDSVYLGATNLEARVTAADINHQTGEVVLLTQTKIVSFVNYPGNRFFDGIKSESYFVSSMGQIEAISFTGDGRIFITEEGSGSNAGFLYEVMWP